MIGGVPRGRGRGSGRGGAKGGGWGLGGLFVARQMVALLDSFSLTSSSVG